MDSKTLPTHGTIIDNIKSNLGTLFLGLTMSSMLYGVSALQFFVYYQSGKKDGPNITFTVWAVWILDTLHQAFVIHGVYWFFVLNYNNFLVFESDTWTLPATNFCFTSIFVFVNGLFTFRLWKLSHNRTLIIIVVVLVVASTGMSTAWTVKALSLPLIDAFVLRRLTWATAATGATTDLVIAISLSYYLHSKRSGFKALNSIVNKLIAYTVTTGLISFIFAIGVLIMDLARPHDYYFIMFHFILGKLYSNTLLASLNYRDKIRAVREVDQCNTVSFAIPYLRRKWPAAMSTVGTERTEREPHRIIMVDHVIKHPDNAFITKGIGNVNVLTELSSSVGSGSGQYDSPISKGVQVS